MSKTSCHSRIIKRRLVWICQASPLNQPFIFLNYLSEHSCYLLVILRSNVNWDLRASLCNGGNTFFSILSPYFESVTQFSSLESIQSSTCMFAVAFLRSPFFALLQNMPFKWSTTLRSITQRHQQFVWFDCGTGDAKNPNMLSNFTLSYGFEFIASMWFAGFSNC